MLTGPGGARSINGGVDGGVDGRAACKKGEPGFALTGSHRGTWVPNPGFYGRPACRPDRPTSVPARPAPLGPPGHCGGGC